MLFTDIEGSTRLAQGTVLADHDRVLREAWRMYAGTEIGTEGNSFFVVFRRAQDAVAAAVAAQRALAESGDLRVRMGMHTAEPGVGGEGYVGLGVNRAARVAAAAHGGQVLLSEVARGELGPELPAGVELRDLGPQRLKDFPEPERLHQLVIDGLQSAFPPLETARDSVPFSGADDELAATAGVARRSIAIAAVAVLAVAAVAAGGRVLDHDRDSRPTPVAHPAPHPASVRHHVTATS
jgi:hypothetical protein